MVNSTTVDRRHLRTLPTRPVRALARHPDIGKDLLGTLEAGLDAMGWLGSGAEVSSVRSLGRERGSWPVPEKKAEG